MNIDQLINPDRVICLADISSKKKLLEKLSLLLGKGAEGYDPAEIFHRLVERERLGSTGLGHGVALPHGRLGDKDKTVGAFIKLDTGIGFDSPDGNPVNLLFALLVPEHHTNEHLQILASLANMFSNTEFCESLRQCHTDEDLYKQLSQWTISSQAS